MVGSLQAVWHSADIKVELNLLCKTAVPFRGFLPLLGSFLELLRQGQSVRACVVGRKPKGFGHPKGCFEIAKLCQYGHKGTDMHCGICGGGARGRNNTRVK